MNPSFSSYLVNDVFGDPGVYVEVRWSKRALLFDLGHNDRLGPTRLLRANDIFISHTHLDHFIGFDAVLRVALGRGKTRPTIRPSWINQQCAGQIAGLHMESGRWLSIDPRRPGVSPQEIRRALFRATDGFHQVEQPARPLVPEPATGQFTVLNDPMFTVSAVSLNHRVPSFAYSLEEQFHINVNKQKLHEADLPVGSWLKDVKQYIWRGQPDEFRFTATLYDEHHREERSLCWARLKNDSAPSHAGKRSPTSSTLGTMKRTKRKSSPSVQAADVLLLRVALTWTVDVGKARRSLPPDRPKQAGLMARQGPSARPRCLSLLTTVYRSRRGVGAGSDGSVSKNLRREIT